MPKELKAGYGFAKSYTALDQLNRSAKDAGLVVKAGEYTYKTYLNGKEVFSDDFGCTDAFIRGYAQSLKK